MVCSMGLLLHPQVHAQPPDSLLALWHDPSRSDSIRLRALYDLTWDGYIYSKPDSAILLGMEMQREARAVGLAYFDARASELMAAAEYVKGDLRTAILHYDTALALNERIGDQEGIADVIGNQAGMYSVLGERDKALALYEKSRRIHEEVHDSVGIANDLNAIGAVHVARGDHARASDFYMQSIHLYQALHDESGMASGQKNLGALFMREGDYAAALEHYRQALPLAEKLNNQQRTGQCLGEIGVCLEDLGDTAAAMDHYQRSLAVRQLLDDRRGVANVQTRIGALWLKEGRLQRSMQALTKAVAMAREEELPWSLSAALTVQANLWQAKGDHHQALDLAKQAHAAALDAEDIVVERDALEAQVKSLRALHRWKKALDVQDRLAVLVNSMERDENKRTVLRNEYRFKYEQRAANDSLRHAMEAGRSALRTEQRLARERSIRNIIFALGVLALAVAVALRQRARVLRRTNAAIMEAQAKLVESERQREALEVRTNIARDIHDDLGGELTKITLLSSEAKRSLGRDPDAAASALTRIGDLSRTASATLHDVVHAVDPGKDNSVALVEHARLVAERLLDGSGVRSKLRFGHEGARTEIDPSVRHDLMLLLKEALNKALKHAEASEVAVGMAVANGRFWLDVADDGKGMPPGTYAGNGLANMRERAHRMGASFNIHTAPAAGFRVQVHGPLTS